MSKNYRPPTAEELLEGKRLVSEGWYQTSRAARMIARLPAGLSGREALAQSSYYVHREMAASALDERSCGHSYLASNDVPAEDRRELSIGVFNAFRAAGGETYQGAAQGSLEEKIDAALRELHAAKTKLETLKRKRAKLRENGCES